MSEYSEGNKRAVIFFSFSFGLYTDKIKRNDFFQNLIFLVFPEFSHCFQKLRESSRLFGRGVKVEYYDVKKLDRLDDNIFRETVQISVGRDQ